MNDDGSAQVREEAMHLARGLLQARSEISDEWALRVVDVALAYFHDPWDARSDVQPMGFLDDMVVLRAAADAAHLSDFVRGTAQNISTWSPKLQEQLQGWEGRL